MKRKVFMAVLLGLVLCLSACGKEEAPSQPKESVENKEEEKDAPDEQKKETEMIESAELDANDEAEVQEPVSITVYYSNDDATAFNTSEAELSVLSPEEIVKALTEKGVLTADIQVRSVKDTEADGAKAIEVDFNDAFASYVSNMGTTGEYYIIGGVCNTFLEAYDCSKIKITVEGGTFTTGHAEYPGYMSKFE